MFGVKYIPIRYKFLFVLLVLLLTSLSLFGYFAYKTFAEDKKLFVMDLNLSILKSATSEIKSELKSRLEQIQIIAPKVYHLLPTKENQPNDPFQGIASEFSEELLGISFYKKAENGGFEMLRDYKNQNVITERKLPANILAQINQRHPLNLSQLSEEQGMDLVNRSLHVRGLEGSSDLSILTVLLAGNFVDVESQGFIIVVDLIGDFLRKKLQQSEVAEIFLLSNKGTLISHPSLLPTIEYASSAFPHPIIEKLTSSRVSRESIELMVRGEAYLCNYSETSFKDVFAVSQIKKSKAFEALKLLVYRTSLLAALILFSTVMVSIIFAGRLTSHIQRLKMAAEQIGTGNLNVNLSVKTNDEIQSVSESFQWMANRLSVLISESVQKARMENELQTARLVQSTLLSSMPLESEAIEVLPHYVPASECGGDFWDAFLNGNKLTVIIGDATGHGVPAALLTAIAKSCLCTLNNIFADQPLTPEQLLLTLNLIIHNACRGQLLMTMCIAQIDLETGECWVSNGGHESPLCLRANRVISIAENTDNKRRHSAEVFFTRGERLGFDPSAEYKLEHFKLNIGDIVLLYSDGISEACNADNKEWGERALKKSFVRGGTRPLSQILSEMVGGVNEHMKGTPQKDDITFVLVQWKHKVIPILRPKPQLPRYLQAEVENIEPVSDDASIPASARSESARSGHEKKPVEPCGEDRDLEPFEERSSPAAWVDEFIIENPGEVKESEGESEKSGDVESREYDESGEIPKKEVA